MNLFSVREAADRLGKSPRRIQQIAARDHIGTRVGNSLAFSAQDLARLRGRHPTRVFVEIHLEEGVFQKFRDIAMKKELSPEAFLSQLLNNTSEDKG